MRDKKTSSMEISTKVQKKQHSAFDKDAILTQNRPKVALVTGAAHRIGRAIALELAKANWDIGVHYNNSEESAKEVAEEICSMGRQAIILPADLNNEAEVMQLMHTCNEQLGLPQCLVNNASQFQYDVASTFNYASLESNMRINAGAPILLARELYALLIKAQIDGETTDLRGVVINILDQKLSNLNPDFFSYTLSKAALQTATTMLAQALAPQLRIVAIAPGITLPANSQNNHQSQENFQKAHKMSPLKRSSTTADIAQAVCYLVNAKSITGTTLFVDGGQHLTPLSRDFMFFSE